MRLDDVGLVRLGQWTENLFTKEKPLQLQQPSSGPLFGSGPLKVITVFNAPYLMLKNSSKELFGNDRYEGYVVDLIHELSRVLKFEYEIHILASEKYGNCNQVRIFDKDTVRSFNSIFTVFVCVGSGGCVCVCKDNLISSFLEPFTGRM